MKMAPKTTKHVVENISSYRISKNLVLCLRHFTVESFTNKPQFDAGFSTKRWRGVDFIGSDSNVAPHKSEYLFLLCGHYLCVFN